MLVGFTKEISAYWMELRPGCECSACIQRHISSEKKKQELSRGDSEDMCEKRSEKERISKTKV
jgi:hypothetical protein